MHNYQIKITKYTEAGSLTNDYICKTADNIAQAKQIVYEYDKLKYQTVDPDTGEITVGSKMYKVELQVCTYKTVDKDAYFAMFDM